MAAMAFVIRVPRDRVKTLHSLLVKALLFPADCLVSNPCRDILIQCFFYFLFPFVVFVLDIMIVMYYIFALEVVYFSKFIELCL